MKKILLPTDFSKNAWDAIQYALTLFKDEKCTFFIMNSYDPITSAPTTAVTSHRSKAAILESVKLHSEEDLKKILNQILELKKNIKHQFETISINAPFDIAVRSIVEKNNIDLVVLGTKGASGLKEITLGSNTSGLIGKLVCPMITVPSDPILSPLHKIGFATDYTIDEYGKGLSILEKLAKTHKSKILVVHVLNKNKAITPEIKSNQQTLKNTFKGLEIEFINLTDVPVELGTRIFSESTQLDMLCVITKKHGFIDKLFNKSYSKSISHHAKVPLIIFNSDAF